MALHVKKGDTVVVRSGADKGKRGKVLAAFPKENRVLVEGVNVKKRHERPRRQNQKGQIVEKSLPIHASKVVREDKYQGSKK